jgi:hypothetical protein
MGVGSFTTVIVPRSAFEAAREPQQAHNLVQAVAKFVHTMMGQGLYTRDELLPKATHAFLAGYYLSQVNHGGHREFIHNNFVNIDLSLSDLRAALAAIGTEPYRSIAERLIAWCGERRDPVTHKIDLSNRGQSDFLGDLDREFTAADKASPLNNLLAGWIAAWPELRVVDDADYPEALRLSVTMNPLRSLAAAAMAIGPPLAISDHGSLPGGRRSRLPENAAVEIVGARDLDDHADHIAAGSMEAKPR